MSANAALGVALTLALVCIAALVLAAPGERPYPNGLMNSHVVVVPPMMCGNQLQFNVACNSQYLGKGLIE